MNFNLLKIKSDIIQQQQQKKKKFEEPTGYQKYEMSCWRWPSLTLRFII